MVPTKGMITPTMVIGLVTAYSHSLTLTHWLELLEITTCWLITVSRLSRPMGRGADQDGIILFPRIL